MRIRRFATLFLRLPAEEKGLFFEAFWRLAVARAAVRTLPFRTIASRLARRTRSSGDDDRAGGKGRVRRRDDPSFARSVGKAVVSVSRHTPWNSNCLAQALAATAMLSRREIPATLHLGVAKHDGELTAHAWVRSRGVPVTGGRGELGHATVWTFEDPGVGDGGGGAGGDAIRAAARDAGIPAELSLAAALAALALPGIGPESVRRIRGIVEACLREKPDWEAFERCAMVHGLHRMVVSSPDFGSGSACPRPLRRRLVLSGFRTVLAGSNVRRSCERTRNILAAAGIDSFEMKGAGQAERLYGTQDLRPSGDVDLCVRPADAAGASEVLRESGYRQTDGQEPLRPGSLPPDSQHHASFVDPATGTVVEVHWTLVHTGFVYPFTGVPGRAGAPDDPFGMSRWFPDGDIDPEERFAYAIYHGASHRFFHLKWLADAACLFANEDRALRGRVAARMEELGLGRVFGLSGRLCALFFGLECDTESATAGSRGRPFRGRGRWMDRLEALAIRQIVRNEDLSDLRDRKSLEWMRLLVLKLEYEYLCLDGVRARLRFLAHTAGWGVRRTAFRIAAAARTVGRPGRAPRP